MAIVISGTEKKVTLRGMSQESGTIRAIGAIDKANEVMKELGLVANTSGNALRTANLRYDSDALDWVPVTGLELETEAVEVQVDTDDLEDKVDVLHADNSPLGKYGFMGFDDTTTAGYVYTFWEDVDGAWYIAKIKTSTGTAAYATGASGSAAAFADPSNQSFDTFAAKF